MSRVYVIEPKSGGVERLIRANTPAQALRFATHSMFEIDVASQDDLIAALAKGIVVEDATREPEPTAEG